MGLVALIHGNVCENMKTEFESKQCELQFIRTRLCGFLVVSTVDELQTTTGNLRGSASEKKSQYALLYIFITVPFIVRL